MKRTFAKLLSLFVVLTLVIAMVPAVFAVDGTVSVTAGNTTLKVGNIDDGQRHRRERKLTVTNVTLTSGHADIVSVIDSSTITALKVGSATITATVTEDGETQTLGSVTDHRAVGRELRSRPILLPLRSMLTTRRPLPCP